MLKKSLPERLVAIVKPFQFKTGSWVVTVPKDVLRENGYEESLRKGVKVEVYWNGEEHSFVYRLPEPQPGDI